MNNNIRRSGIYCIRVNGIPYVGKDWDINREKRIKSHLAYLKRGKHWNKEMQLEYDTTKNFTSEVLWESDKLLDDAELCVLETKFIHEIDSYNTGFNKTLGGIGLSGIKFTEEQLARKSENTIGSKNPMSKISLEQFLEIVDMLKAGHNNVKIGDKFGLNDRYVSLIRNKRRYIKWFEQYAPDYKVVSGKKFQIHTNLTEAVIKDVYIQANKNKVASKVLADKHNISIDAVNNIKSRRTFKGVTSDL